MLTKEEEKQMYDELIAYENERKEAWNKVKEELHGLIHPKYFDFMETMESYHSEGVVEINEVEDKQNGYPESQRNCRIKAEGYSGLYMYTTGEVEYLYGEEGDYDGEGVEYWVNQWSNGIVGDSYAGFLLLPLNNGKYWKVGYSC
jgi:hypothetical protein